MCVIQTSSLHLGREEEEGLAGILPRPENDKLQIEGKSNTPQSEGGLYSDLKWLATACRKLTFHPSAELDGCLTTERGSVSPRFTVYKRETKNVMRQKENRFTSFVDESLK